MTYGVSVTSTLYGSLTALSTGASVYPPLLLGTSTITYFTPAPLQNLSYGGAKYTSSSPSKAKSYWTQSPTKILATALLPYTLPFYLQVQIPYSCYIPIPPRLLSTLTLRSSVSREFFVSALMSMMLNYTRRNTCLLVPFYSNNISLDYTNQSLLQPNPRSD